MQWLYEEWQPFSHKKVYYICETELLYKIREATKEGILVLRLINREQHPAASKHVLPQGRTSTEWSKARERVLAA